MHLVIPLVPAVSRASKVVLVLADVTHFKLGHRLFLRLLLELLLSCNGRRELLRDGLKLGLDHFQLGVGEVELVLEARFLWLLWSRFNWLLLAGLIHDDVFTHLGDLLLGKWNSIIILQ